MFSFLEISTGPVFVGGVVEHGSATPFLFKFFSFIELVFIIFFNFFLFLELISFFGIIVTFSNSASIIFKVDSFISFIIGFKFSPIYLYKIQIKLVAEVLTCGFVFPAINLQKLMISFMGKLFISLSSINLLKKMEYSHKILGLFFLVIFDIKFDIMEQESIIDSSIAVLINSMKFSFNLISAIFS